MNYPSLQALLIDIDDTIVQLRPAASRAQFQHADHWTGSLLEVVQLAGEKMAGLPADEVAGRIARTKHDVRWWQIGDFLAPLGIPETQFWEFAYETERPYLEPTGAEIQPALDRLRRGGVRLYITSNNPNTSILHKLRLAGITDVAQFERILGASELQAMKWEPVFWEKALASVGLPGSQVAVVGDNPRDDYEVPRCAGIAHSFLIDRARDRAAENSSTVTYVRDFSRIADSILGFDTGR
jgi:HAD superfamily hydrolase (TIGR01549 family)